MSVKRTGNNAAIITAIQKIAGTYNAVPVKLCLVSVVSVDKTARTCVVNSIDSQSDNDGTTVNLMVEVDDGVLTTPSVGSTIAILFTDYTTPFAIAYTEIDEIETIVGDQGYDIKTGLQQFNDGSYGGLVQLIQLVTKLNNLENLVNDLVTKFNSHTHILTLTSGTGTAAVTVAPETTTLTPTERADLENTNITHGPTL